MIKIFNNNNTSPKKLIKKVKQQFLINYIATIKTIKEKNNSIKKKKRYRNKNIYKNTARLSLK